MYNFIDFAHDLEKVVSFGESYEEIIKESVPCMAKLIRNRNLFTPDYLDGLLNGESNPYLYKSERNEFVVKVFVWEPGSRTPIHDHLTWGLMGIYHNSLKVDEYELLFLDEAGNYDLSLIDSFSAPAGGICSVSPPDNDIHRVCNPTEELTVSIHVYGNRLAEFNVYDLENNQIIRQISE